MNVTGICHGKCPRCAEGRIFETFTKVRAKCAKCGLSFDRESGYFLGALYIEYGIAGAILAVLTLILHAVLTLRLQTAILAAFIVFLPFIPLTIHLSRTLWIYWDNAVDPQKA
jgi:uncharacterized protein (DUF983 family)